MFLLVPAYPGCPGSKAVKRSLLLFLILKTKAGATDSYGQQSALFGYQYVLFIHANICCKLTVLLL